MKNAKYELGLKDWFSRLPTAQLPEKGRSHWQEGSRRGSDLGDYILLWSVQGDFTFLTRTYLLIQVWIT